MKIFARGVCGAIIALVLSNPARAKDAEMEPYAGVEGWAEDRDARMAGWREARFGLFVHWGLYSAAGGYWPPDPISGEKYAQHYSEWIQNWAQVPPAEYARRAKPLFTAEHFDARAWAALARRAGMKYAVLTTKHHEGFTLFNSQAPYSVDNPVTGGTNISPEGRDLVGEFTEAFRAAGLKVGYYYSLLDWQHPDAPELSLPAYPREARARDYANYVRYVHRHLEELFTRYGTVDILWPDYSSENFQGSFWKTRDLLGKIRTWQPGLVINNRFWSGLENPNADFKTPEKYVPATGWPGVDWEVCHTMNESFGFSFHDQKWKTVDETIRLLVDVASKGGNLLLNVGPTADGRIPEPAVALLEGVGDWMRIHASAIHGTVAGPFPFLPWGRATRKGDTIFLFVFDWPADGVLQVPLLNRIRSVRLMGGGDLCYESAPYGVRVALPAKPVHSTASVIAVGIVGEPRVSDRNAVAAADGRLTLEARTAELRGGLRLENPPEPNIGFWSDPEAAAEWKVRIARPGSYRVTAQVARPARAGGILRLEFGSQSLSAEVPDTGGWQVYREIELGLLVVEQADLGQDSLRITLRGAAIRGQGLANIRALTLTPRP